MAALPFGGSTAVSPFIAGGLGGMAALFGSGAAGVATEDEVTEFGQDPVRMTFEAMDPVMEPMAEFIEWTNPISTNRPERPARTDFLTGFGEQNGMFESLEAPKAMR
ncbi:MAG: hypothetical protein ACI8PZ_000460 [Myxococcota bacterium]|jgi:hypothetical protein